MTPHPTDEQLSGALDGEDLEAAAHAEGCPSCEARLAELASVRDALGAAGEPPVDPARRDAAIAAAMGAPAPVIALTPAPSRRGVPGWLLAAAAVVLAVVVAVPLLANRSEERGDARQAALESAELSASARPLGDLGDHTDADALGRLVQGGGVGSTAENAGGAADSDAGPPPQQPAPGGLNAARPTGSDGRSARAAGPACEGETRTTYGSGLGPLTAWGTLRWEGTPAVLLVYALAEPQGQFRQRGFVVREAGCALLTVFSL